MPSRHVRVGWIVDVQQAGGPRACRCLPVQSAQANFANFERRIHSLLGGRNARE